MGSFTTSDGAAIHYREAAAGPPIVIVPGAFVAARYFDRQLAALSRVTMTLAHVDLFGENRISSVVVVAGAPRLLTDPEWPHGFLTVDAANAYRRAVTSACTDVSNAEVFAALAPHARVEVFEESGHSPFIEEAERFNAARAAFASRHRDAPLSSRSARLRPGRAWV